jgi:hypothetical protein
VHAFPGFVNTPLATKAPGAVGLLGRAIGSVMSMTGTGNPEACGEYMWHGLLSSGPGSARVGSRGTPLTSAPPTKGILEPVWDHTATLTGVSK